MPRYVVTMRSGHAYYVTADTEREARITAARRAKEERRTGDALQVRDADVKWGEHLDSGGKSPKYGKAGG